MSDWAFVGALCALVIGVLGCLWLYLENLKDEREYADRLREMQDEIDGIVR